MGNNDYNIPLSLKLSRPLETKLVAIMKKYDMDRSAAIRYLINREAERMSDKEKKELGLKN